VTIIFVLVERMTRLKGLRHSDKGEDFDQKDILDTIECTPKASHGEQEGNSARGSKQHRRKAVEVSVKESHDCEGREGRAHGAGVGQEWGEGRKGGMEWGGNHAPF